MGARECEQVVVAQALRLADEPPDLEPPRPSDRTAASSRRSCRSASRRRAGGSRPAGRAAEVRGERDAARSGSPEKRRSATREQTPGTPAVRRAEDRRRRRRSSRVQTRFRTDALRQLLEEGADRLAVDPQADHLRAIVDSARSSRPERCGGGGGKPTRSEPKERRASRGEVPYMGPSTVPTTRPSCVSDEEACRAAEIDGESTHLPATYSPFCEDSPSIAVKLLLEAGWSAPTCPTSASHATASISA